MNTPFQRHILVTGGAGFIGSHLVRHLVNRYPHYLIVNLDLLTYAGNLSNLADIELSPNYVFAKGDICDAPFVAQLITQHHIDSIIHLAAESHVDRSIEEPLHFARVNVLGTLTLLQAAKEAWQGDFDGKRYYQISTDEVYGALRPGDPLFTEQTAYTPHSPYSASKASADHFVRAYADTYGLPVVLSNCSNTYGPNQFPEKLIPLVINNIKHQRPIPVYGTGANIRDWLYVGDHVAAIDLIFHEGKNGETYNIGSNCERSNLQMVQTLIATTDRLLGRKDGSSESLITFVTDRAGHDFRYAIDASKIRSTLGWRPCKSFDEGIEETVAWYLSHTEWLEGVTSGIYMKYYEEMYGGR